MSYYCFDAISTGRIQRAFPDLLTPVIVLDALVVELYSVNSAYDSIHEPLSTPVDVQYSMTYPLYEVLPR